MSSLTRMEDSEEILLKECRQGNVEEVQTLLEARAADPDSLDINYKGATAASLS